MSDTQLINECLDWEDDREVYPFRLPKIRGTRILVSNVIYVLEAETGKDFTEVTEEEMMSAVEAAGYELSLDQVKASVAFCVIHKEAFEDFRDKETADWLGLPT